MIHLIALKNDSLSQVSGQLGWGTFHSSTTDNYE